MSSCRRGFDGEEQFGLPNMGCRQLTSCIHPNMHVDLEQANIGD